MKVRPKNPLLMASTASILLLVVVALAAVAVGAAGRRVLPEQVTLEATSPSEAFTKLESTGVQGRTLVVLDRSSHVSDVLLLADSMRHARDALYQLPVTYDSLVEGLIECGISRNARIVIPDSEWEAFRASAAEVPRVLPLGAGLVRRLYGAPIFFGSQSLFDATGEKAVVVIVENNVGAYDPEFVQKVTDPGHADVVLTLKGEW